MKRRERKRKQEEIVKDGRDDDDGLDLRVVPAGLASPMPVIFVLDELRLGGGKNTL